jgi:thiamine-phosphate pyrophosphorylase
LDPRLAFVAQPADSPKFDNAVRSAILGGATSIQLRAKNCPTRQFIQLARRTQSIVNETCTAASTIPLIINDRLDVALAVGADGIHVGQDDMPLEEVRNLVGPDFIVGSTVSNPAQAKESELHGADYLGTDAIFSTASKPDSLPLGISTFADICASVSIPVLGIGGINAMNCADVIGAGASGVAVISAIQNADNPLAAARLLRQTVDHHLPHYSREWAHKAADILQQLRQKKPLVQHLTNYVVMNQTGVNECLL